jgi:hypothetical protein
LALVTSRLPTEKPDNTGQIYKPPQWGWRLLIAFLTSDKRPTVQEACKRAGISRDTFYRHLNDPEFVRWFERTKKEALSATLSEIQLEHFWLAKQAKDERVRLDAITEYEDRFIPRDAQVVESLPATVRDITPQPRQYPVQIQDKSEQFKALLGRVIEHSIKKAQVYGQEMPKDWRPLAAAMDEFEKEQANAKPNQCLG